MSGGRDPIDDLFVLAGLIAIFLLILAAGGAGR